MFLVSPSRASSHQVTKVPGGARWLDREAQKCHMCATRVKSRLNLWLRSSLSGGAAVRQTQSSAVTVSLEGSEACSAVRRRARIRSSSDLDSAALGLPSAGLYW